MARWVVGVLACAAALTGGATAADGQWHLSDLRVSEAHRITRGAGVVVAVIDTGVDAKHRDLVGAVLPGYNTAHDRWDEATGREDLVGHGTAMASIIAGRGSRGGVLGIAPAAMILPISTSVDSVASSSDLAEAIDVAIARRARVINMSFGGGDDRKLHDAVRRAQAADIVLVAASGNDGTPGEFPGRYPEVLTVGAYGRDDRIDPVSVVGPQVDLAAPGAEILCASIKPGGYAVSTGTSDATAVVSGAAALVRARFPALSAAEVVHRLTATADDAGAPGRDDTYGYGRLNLVRALTADVAPLPAGATVGPSSEPAPPPGHGWRTGRPLPRPVGLLEVAAVAGVLLGAVAVLVLVVFWRRARRR